MPDTAGRTAARAAAGTAAVAATAARTVATVLSLNVCSPISEDSTVRDARRTGVAVAESNRSRTGLQEMDFIEKIHQIYRQELIAQSQICARGGRGARGRPGGTSARMAVAFGKVVERAMSSRAAGRPMQ